MAESEVKLFLKKAFPRILKATVWGTLTFIIAYYLPMMIYPKDILPLEYTTPLFNFALIFVFFAVVGQLFSGTVIGCGFGVAKAIIMIAYFFAISDAGIINLAIPISEFTVNLAVDISIPLLMIISVNLFEISKYLLSAIVILTEKSGNINLNES